MPAPLTFHPLPHLCLLYRGIKPSGERHRSSTPYDRSNSDTFSWAAAVTFRIQLCQLMGSNRRRKVSIPICCCKNVARVLGIGVFENSALVFWGQAKKASVISLTDWQRSLQQSLADIVVVELSRRDQCRHFCENDADVGCVALAAKRCRPHCFAFHRLGPEIPFVYALTS